MNSASPDKKRTWLRFAGLLLAIGIMVWLPIEESSELGVLVVSGLICIWGGIWLLTKTGVDDKHLILRHILVGFGAGLLVAPVAILLMAIKSGIHGHGSPDFTVSQMQNVLSRVPYFALGGVLVGTGSGMLQIMQRKQSQEG